MKTKKKKVSSVVKVERKILGVAANIKNLLIAVAMLFAFLGGFFQVYNWAETRFAKEKHLQQVEVINDYRWESTVLQGMNSRLWTLDNMVNLAPDPTKVPPEIKTQYNDLKAQVKLQEEKVKVLQEKACK
jgi:hypothetical protein